MSEVSIRAPDSSLRKKIGATVAMNTIFTPERIRHCQEMADKMLAESLREMETQLTLLGEEYMTAANNPAQAEAAMKRGAELSFIIKKRMETLNFAFGFATAKSLSDYLQHVAFYHPDVMLIVCKHVAVLNIILKDQIKGDGGATGEKLLVNLRALIDKTHK